MKTITHLAAKEAENYVAKMESYVAYHKSLKISKFHYPEIDECEKCCMMGTYVA